MNQDNPFAKGVSINQDIVYDVSESGCVSVDVKSTEELYDLRNAELYANHPTLEEDLRKCFEETIPMMDTKKTRQQRRYAKPVHEWKKQIDRHYAISMEAVRSKSARQLLALGREEE